MRRMQAACLCMRFACRTSEIVGLCMRAACRTSEIADLLACACMHPASALADLYVKAMCSPPEAARFRCERRRCGLGWRWGCLLLTKIISRAGASSSVGVVATPVRPRRPVHPYSDARLPPSLALPPARTASSRSLLVASLTLLSHTGHSHISSSGSASRPRHFTWKALLQGFPPSYLPSQITISSPTVHTHCWHLAQFKSSPRSSTLLRSPSVSSSISSSPKHP